MNDLILVMMILLATSVNFKHSLHMFQQNRYEFQRYTDWLVINKLKNFGFYIQWLLLLNLFFWSYNFWGLLICIWEITIICIISLILEAKKKYIKPLVLTARVKRQIVVLAIIDFLFIALAVYSDLVLKLLFMGSILTLNWFTIYLMAYVTKPLEAAIAKHYLNLAKEIIDARDDLIKIGITGSFGKTSTKNILQQVLSEQYYSLMTPASFNTPMGITITIRNDLKRTHDVFICEMGADHQGDILELMDFIHPKYGIVTSIGPQHLNTFKSLENIINEKMLMIEKLPSDGIGIINYDNEYIRDYKIQNTCKVIKVGIDNKDVDYYADNIHYSQKGSSFDINYDNQTYHFETCLLGKYNITNILVAIALATQLGISWEQTIKAVKAIRYIEHRLELKKINGYTFIDNAFNSNPSGAKMSLEVLSRMAGQRIIVTPGMIDLGKKQDEINYDFGANMINNVDQVILVGAKQTQAIYQGLIDSSFPTDKIAICDTVQEAFSKVYEIASYEDTILLENDLPDAFNN